MGGEGAKALADLNQAELTIPVRKALGSETVEIGNWSVEPIRYDATNPVSGGVYRVAGTGREAGQTGQWSLVLKVVRSPEGREARYGRLARRPYWPGVFLPGEGLDSPPMYWKREPLAYASGLLGDLPVGLAAPRCFAVVEKSRTCYWLWLEDVADAYEGRWSLDRYVETALHLGRFNGAYLTGHTRPHLPWLARRWMRSWLHQLAQCGGMERIVGDAWKLPSIRHAFPPTMANRLKLLWGQREDFLAALDRLPQTLCHRDVFPANLLTRRRGDGQKETVALDWAFVGIGPVGEDLPSLIALSAPPEMRGIGPAELQKPVFEAYVQGLHEAGWAGDARLVRLGYAASAALRYACLTAGVVLLHALDDGLRAAMEERRGEPIERVLETEAEVFSFCLDLADEARRLRHSPVA